MTLTIPSVITSNANRLSDRDWKSLMEFFEKPGGTEAFVDFCGKKLGLPAKKNLAEQQQELQKEEQALEKEKQAEAAKSQSENPPQSESQKEPAKQSK